MNQERLIFHIDVNSAFLSWESVYRLSQDPTVLDLRTVPSAVGGDASSRHGIVLAKSTPAKRFGVTTGEPLVQALRKCPELLVVPSRFEIYTDYSHRLMQLLETYSPDIEKFSIDEAFLDMTSSIHLFGDPLMVARQLREQIYKELGFTVNIGIAPNKLLAKMASDFKKPNLCHTLFYEEVPTKMWPLPIGRLFFVGHSAREKLESVGIHTIGQLAACDIGMLRARLGGRYAALIHDYANGIDDAPVKERDPINKSYSANLTLSRDVSDYEAARQVLLSLCETVGARLRADQVQCSCVCVEIKDWEFCTHSHQMTLLSPTSSTTAIYENACQLLRDFWKRTPLRLISVRAAKITDSAYSQMNLFEPKKNQKMMEFEKAVDQIRGKYGTDSIMRASFLQKDSIADHASGKQKHLSGPGS